MSKSRSPSGTKTFVFLSWSGDRSKTVATALKNWLPFVFQTIEVWVSEHDIHAGSPWASELYQQLQKADFGVLCFTEENLDARWLLYEAGALAMSVKQGALIPYLVGVEPNQVALPISQFQGVNADKEGTWRLVERLNEVITTPLEKSHLEKVFQKWWPELSSTLGGGLQLHFDKNVAVLTLSRQTAIEENWSMLRPQADRLLDQGCRRIIINLENVEFVSSSSFVQSSVAPGGQFAKTRKLSLRGSRRRSPSF